PSGALVATDDGGAADGRNALLNAVATTAGTYTLRVRGTGGTAGEYVLDGAPAASADGRPGTPDLLAASDTGVSATDDLTRLDNGAPGRALQFMVPGTIPGATVELFVGGVLIGSAVAIGTSTLVTTDGATVLADGAHAITARQTPAGGTASPASDAMGLTVKTATLAAPAAPILQAASDSGLSATDGLTNDATPTFDVTAGGAAYYRVYRDGAVVSGPGETAAAFTSAALADGTYAFTVSAVDAAGNESAPSPAATVTVDTVGPTAAITQPDVDAASDTGVSSTDNVTSVTAPTLAITLPPAGLYYRLLKDFTVLVGDAYATATSVTLPAQPDGATIWGLKYVDGAGNESIGGVGTTVTIDTVAPATPVAPDLQAASDTGASTTDDVTSDTTPTFDVVGAPYFRVYRDGVLVSTTYPSGTTYTSATLANGTYVFAVSSVDAAGNESARSAPISVTIDTTIPALPLLYSGSDTGQSTSDRVTRFNNATPAAALYLMIPLTPAGATVTLYADGVAVGSAVSAGAAMFVATDGSTVLADGVRAMSYRYALPGQPASPGSSILPVTVDATAPDAPGAPDVSSGSDTGASTSDDVTTSRTPSITVAAGGSFYRLFVDGAQASADYQAGTFTLPSRSDGAYVLTAVAVDAAGNVSAPSAATTLTIDNVEPFPPLVAPDLQDASDSGTSNADNLTNDLTPTFDVPGVPAGGYFRVYRNGTVIGGSYQTGTSYTAPSQTSGTYAYTFAYVDAAGNVSLQSPGLTVTFDTAGPANVGAPDLQTASDSGSSSGDNVTNVRRPTFTLPAGVVPYWRFYQSGARISGLFETGATFTVPTDLADGTHQFTVRAVDDAGNESGTSSLGVTIDTTAPTAPTAAPDLQAASDTGGSTTDNYTADDTPTFAISGAGTTWRLYRGATLVSGAYQTGSTFTAPAQADGADAWTLVAVDPAGNESAPGPATTVTIDRAAPVVTVDVVATTLTSPALTGTVSEPGSQVTVVFEGASYPAAVAADGSWAVPAGVIPAVAPGTYDVVTTATDLAGNARTQTAVGVLRVGVPAPVMDAEPPATRGAQNTVAWAPVAGATAYYVEADADPEFGSPDASSGWIAGTSHTFTGLADGVTYHYRVRARQAVTNVGNWGQTTQAEFDAGARTGVVTTPAGQVVLATGTTVNLADDFEDGDFAGWTAVSPNYARQVTSATAGSGVYSLTMTGGNLTHSDGLYRTSFGATIPTRATFYVRGTVKHTSRGYFVLRGGTSKSAWFMMDNDGTMGLVSDGGLRQHNVPFVLDRWYRVTLDFDWAGKTIDYSVDGALVGADVPFYSSSATFVDRVDLYNFGSAQSYWDGIALSTTAYATSGTIVSAPISPAQRTAWGVLDYQAAQPAGTAILVDVLDGAGTVLASDLSSGADLAALGIAAPTIRLRARLSTTNAAVTPVLESWGVSFRRGADYTVESAWSAAVSSTQDATAPTVSVTALPTADTTPALAGTVDDPGAVVEVTVNGQAFAAVNNGDGTWALADGVVGPLPFGTQVVAVSATDAAGNKGTTARQLTVVPTPALASWVVNDGAAQRSMVKTVTLSFNTPVTLSTGAIRVYLRVAGGAVTAVTASVTNPTGDLQTYVLKFGAPSTDAAGSLADGAYDVVIASASVRDSLGRSPVGPDLVLTFHRLFGDADGDRDVDAADSSVFAAAQSTRAGASAFRWYFDGDGDTDVDAVDALRFRRQAGKSVSY
ncbi:MAG: beta strand repeat-containing protein, partial [Phycisphaerae bacterium]